ncbi:MAG TPA: hypothetical protein VK846_15375 [Candidatus Limnocylindria bacterium]|nr:hypothetical protein [Candidatus Limnocylindria bacterium]
MTHLSWRKTISARRMLAAIVISLGMLATKMEAVAETVAALALASEAEAAKTVPQSEPPPLDSRIVEMMKTNTVGIIEARIFLAEKWPITPVQKAQVFLSMLAKSGPDDQRKLAHAAVPHIASTSYTLLRKHLLDAQLPRPVLSVFMTDTLKRQNAIKLPTLLALAQIDGHPMKVEAAQLLRAYLGRDYGTNWVQWDQSMQAYLKSNPS